MKMNVILPQRQSFMSGRHSFSVDKVLFSFIILFLNRLAAILIISLFEDMRLTKKENYVKRNKDRQQIIFQRLLPNKCLFK